MKPRDVSPSCAGLLSLILAGLLLAGCGGGPSAAQPPVIVDTSLPAVNVGPVAANDPGSAVPAGWERGPFMQIFVRSYQDSDGDGIGDPRGLISHLDFQRAAGSSRSLVLINYGGSATSLDLASLPAGAQLTALIPTGAATPLVNGAGSARFELPALSAHVYQIGS